MTHPFSSPREAAARDHQEMASYAHWQARKAQEADAPFFEAAFWQEEQAYHAEAARAALALDN